MAIHILPLYLPSPPDVPSQVVSGAPFSITFSFTTEFLPTGAIYPGLQDWGIFFRLIANDLWLYVRRLRPSEIGIESRYMISDYSRGFQCFHYRYYGTVTFNVSQIEELLKRVPSSDETAIANIQLNAELEIIGGLYMDKLDIWWCRSSVVTWTVPISVPLVTIHPKQCSFPSQVNRDEPFGIAVAATFQPTIATANYIRDYIEAEYAGVRTTLWQRETYATRLTTQPELITITVSGMAEYKVIPIVFYPNDVTPNLSYPEVINQAMRVVQSWYALQLGGKTFEYESVVTQKGNHNLDWYKGTVSGIELTKVMEDLKSLGYPISDFPFLDVPENRAYLIFIEAETIAYAWQGERVAVLGEHIPRALITGIEWETNAAKGTIAHELGHAFGEPECPCGAFYADIMCSWGGFPEVSLCNTTEQNLLQNPFFQSGISIQDILGTVPWSQGYEIRIIAGTIATGLIGGASAWPWSRADEEAVAWDVYVAVTPPAPNFVPPDGATLYPPYQIGVDEPFEVIMEVENYGAQGEIYLDCAGIEVWRGTLAYLQSHVWRSGSLTIEELVGYEIATSQEIQVIFETGYIDQDGNKVLVNSTPRFVYVTVAAPPPPTKATLNIDTNPVKGAVYVNGAYRGTAPKTLSLDPGTYTVSFGSVAGYVTPGPVSVTLQQGDTATVTRTYAAIAPGTASLSGTIRDQDGIAIAGATVSIDDLSSITDSAGAYGFTGLQVGDYDIMCAKGGYNTYEDTVHLYQGDNSLDITLEVSGEELPSWLIPAAIGAVAIGYLVIKGK